MREQARLIDCPDGGYRFLPGIEPYSSGVVAMPGHEIVHATLQAPVPYREGFALIERHLAGIGRPRAALCAIELRIPAPLTFDGFGAFNRDYRAILTDWKLLVAGVNPIARTNVAPVVRPPTEPVLYGFSHTRLGDRPGTATFVNAGSGELRKGATSAEGIVRRGETSPDAMAEKVAEVMGTMAEEIRLLKDVVIQQQDTIKDLHARLEETQTQMTEELKLIGFNDSDIGGDVDRRKSTFGMVFLLGSCPISWQSQK